MINLQKETLLNSTLSYCSSCRKTEYARILAKTSGVYLERMCPVNGVHSQKIAADPKWYIKRVSVPQKIVALENTKKSANGCPNDCGPCKWHTAQIILPVISVTNDCNLNCPICFTYNRPDMKYFKSPDDMTKIIEHLQARRKDLQLINITGGEPTLHPEIFDIIKVCRNSGIKKITMNSNGLRIAEDQKFAERIKESGVQVVLSLDTFDPQKSIQIHGTDISEMKKQALHTLCSLNIPTTILCVCIRAINEADVRDITGEYIVRDFVKSITIQNMTYTGKNGRVFMPAEHITMDEVENLLSENEFISQEDFFPLASYHPLCYSAAYYFAHNNKLLSLTKLLDKSLLSEMTDNNYYIRPDRDLSTEFSNGVNNLWAQGESEETIAILKKFIREYYSEKQDSDIDNKLEISEKYIKVIYIHPHMDEYNFDIDRVSRCGDIVPDESGNMVPACSYNLLYRQKDPRFWI